MPKDYICVGVCQLQVNMVIGKHEQGLVFPYSFWVSFWGGGIGFGLCHLKHCMFIGTVLFLLCLGYALYFEFNDLIIKFTSWMLGQNFA